MIAPFDGKAPLIAADAFIARDAVVLGDVTIGAGASIWYGCVLRGDDHAIRIGERTNVQDGTIIHVFKERFPCLIGAGVTIGHGARLHGCTLEDECMVGIGAIVLDGATVETGAVVAAGAVVSPGKTVRRGEMWAGCPARLLRPVKPDEGEFIRWNIGNYAELAARHKAQGLGQG